MHQKISSAKWWTFCTGGGQLTKMICRQLHWKTSCFGVRQSLHAVVLCMDLIDVLILFSHQRNPDNYIMATRLAWIIDWLLLHLVARFLWWNSHVLITWRFHDMEACSSLLALCEGNPSITGWISVTNGQWCEALIFPLLLVWEGWINNWVTMVFMKCHGSEALGHVIW